MKASCRKEAVALCVCEAMPESCVERAKMQQKKGFGPRKTIGVKEEKRSKSRGRSRLNIGDSVLSSLYFYPYFNL